MYVQKIAEEIIKKVGGKVKLATFDFPMKGYVSFQADKNRIKREAEKLVVYDLRDIGRRHNVEIKIKNFSINKTEEVLGGSNFEGKVKVDVFSGVNLDSLKDSLSVTFDSITI